MAATLLGLVLAAWAFSDVLPQNAVHPHPPPGRGEYSLLPLSSQQTLIEHLLRARVCAKKCGLLRAEHRLHVYPPHTTLPAGPWEEASASKSGERDWCPPLTTGSSGTHTLLRAHLSVCVHTCVLLGHSSGIWVSLGRACPLGSRISMVRPSLTVPGRNTKSERWAPKNHSPPSGRL